MSDESTDFELLATRHLDDDLSLEEGQRFAKMIKEDPAKAKEFARISAMHYQLRSVVKYSRAVGPSLPTSTFGFSWWTSFGSGATTMMILCVALYFAFREPRDSQGVPTTTVVESAPKSIAYLTPVTNCEWESVSTKNGEIDREIRSGEEISLREGIAELKLNGGVRLNVEGPVTLILTSANSVVLQQGKLTTYVPWKASDFRLMAGPHRLTAIDAELGVQVRGSSTNIHVFSGEVTATSSPYSIKDEGVGRPNIDIIGDEEDFKLAPVVIKESDAVEFITISSGKTTTRHYKAQREQFASRNSMAGQLPITPRYIEAVKKSNPVAYWRFEAVENHQIRNEIPGGCSLKVTSDLSLPGDATNHVLEPGDIFDENHLVSSEPMDQYFVGPISTELWIKPSHYHRGDLLSVTDRCYPNPELEGKENGNEYGFGFRLVLHPDFGAKPGTVQCGIISHMRKSSAITCCSENNLYKLRTWQHIVMVGGSWGMSLYMDGKEVAFAKYKEKVTLAKGQHLTVGRAHPHPEVCSPFVGQLDELAIYDRVLSPEEIMAHYKAVRDQQKPEPEL